MNAPINSDSQLYTAPETGRSSAPSSYSPSVPISVYRELATELKTTQSTLDALTHQNQQLLRQNQLLRTEIHRFVQSAEQLGHFAGVIPSEPSAASSEPVSAMPPAKTFVNTGDLFPPALSAQPTPQRPLVEHTEPSSGSAALSTSAMAKSGNVAPKGRERHSAGPKPERSQGASKANSAIVPHPKVKKRDRQRPAPDTNQYRLFTEQPEEARPLSRVASRSDLGNLWLATTILLVVVSAFGAGFLIMRPLLSR